MIKPFHHMEIYLTLSLSTRAPRSSSFMRWIFVGLDVTLTTLPWPWPWLCRPSPCSCQPSLFVTLRVPQGCCCCRPRLSGWQPDVSKWRFSSSSGRGNGRGGDGGGIGRRRARGTGFRYRGIARVSLRTWGAAGWSLEPEPLNKICDYSRFRSSNSMCFTRSRRLRGVTGLRLPAQRKVVLLAFGPTWSRGPITGPQLPVGVN